MHQGVDSGSGSDAHDLLGKTAWRLPAPSCGLKERERDPLSSSFTAVPSAQKGSARSCCLNFSMEFKNPMTALIATIAVSWSQRPSLRWRSTA
ncbi:hypothetical protein ACRAWG_15765 [Methylobacterium sp. P31]